MAEKQGDDTVRIRFNLTEKDTLVPRFLAFAEKVMELGKDGGGRFATACSESHFGEMTELVLECEDVPSPPPTSNEEIRELSKQVDELEECNKILGRAHRTLDDRIKKLESWRKS